MLNILGMIILIIILLIIILLYIGVNVKLIYKKQDSEMKGCIKILILKKIKIYSADFPSQDEDDEIEEDDEESDDKDVKELFNLAKPCFKYIKEFIKSFIDCISVEKLDNHLVFGLDSYADTGKYIGYIWAVFAMINSTHKKARLTAKPSFNGSTLNAKGENDFRINILKLLPSVVRLISKKEIRSLIRGVRNG